MRAAIAALCALAIAGCGGEEQPTPQPEPAAQRLGCGEYCQNAGGYGGGEEGEILMRVETQGRVAVEDEAVPVELTCLLEDVPCRGAVLISGGAPDFVDVGRSDLLVEAGATATLAVPMSADAAAALERSGELTASIIADYGDPECPPGSLLPCTAGGEVVIVPGG